MTIYLDIPYLLKIQNISYDTFSLCAFQPEQIFIIPVEY